MGLFLENGTLTVNIANETRQAFRGAVRLYLCRGDRTVLDEQRCEVTVEALSSLDVLHRKVDAADVYDTYLYVDLYDASGNFLTRRTQLLVPPKHFSIYPERGCRNRHSGMRHAWPEVRTRRCSDCSVCFGK